MGPVPLKHQLHWGRVKLLLPQARQLAQHLGPHLALRLERLPLDPVHLQQVHLPGLQLPGLHRQLAEQLLEEQLRLPEVPVFFAFLAHVHLRLSRYCMMQTGKPSRSTSSYPSGVFKVTSVTGH